MARISEIHYSDEVATNSGVSEFVEVALGAGEDPNDFLISLYNQDGTLGLQISLNDPLITTVFDEDAGENVFLINSDLFNFNLSELEDGSVNVFEGVALSNASTNETLDFYDIGAGNRITATEGAAAGSTSSNAGAVDETENESIQFNDPNPETQRNRELSPGESSNCFTPLTPIMTPDGERPAGELKIGDLVLTADRGPQPIRYVYRRTFKATGDARPVLFEKGAVGNTADLLVSQAHRIVIAEKSKVDGSQRTILVNAYKMLNGGTIRLITDMEDVEYIHLMLDQHEVLWSAGIATESWQPHRRNLRKFDAEVREELLRFFPEIEMNDGSSIERGGPVRQPIARREA